jgi:hypothetical protein
VKYRAALNAFSDSLRDVGWYGIQREHKGIRLGGWRVGWSWYDDALEHNANYRRGDNAMSQVSITSEIGLLPGEREITAEDIRNLEEVDDEDAGRFTILGWLWLPATRNECSSRPEW